MINASNTGMIRFSKLKKKRPNVFSKSLTIKKAKILTASQSQFKSKSKSRP